MNANSKTSSTEQRPTMSKKAFSTILAMYVVLGIIAYHLLQYAFTCDSLLPKIFVGILAFGALGYALPYVVGFGILYLMYQLAMGIMQS
ncbi:MAG: hypothetical protein IJA40_05685 [Phascolarctobacterium sp.]|nr:hypothetical protein [Phascolarctobacterium sp.]